MAIFNYVERAREILNNRKKCVGIFLDLTKGLDLIHHNKLLEKMERYVRRGLAHNWFKSYLEKRFQIVEVTHTYNINSIPYTSNQKPIRYGVPQGSILGLVLFTLYINDLPEFLTASNPTLFADYTS